MTTIATFYSREGNRNFPVIVYIATNKNEHWLGDAPLQNIAKQIFECSGPNGHNVEYLLRFVFPIYGRSNLSYFIFFFLFLLFSSLSLSLSHTHFILCVTHRLAEFMHRYLPEAHDEHLFTLEILVRSKIKEMNICLNTLMGDRNFNIDIEDTDVKDDDNDLVTNNAIGNLRKNSFQFTLQVPDKTMRCLKM